MNIKDSGERTTFNTGAQRDMHSGKGRMDLLPWAAIIEVSKHCEAGALKYGTHNVDKGIPTSSLMDSAMRHATRGEVSGQTGGRGSPAGGGVEPAVGDRDALQETGVRGYAVEGQCRRVM